MDWQVLATERGGAAMVLAIMDGDHALYKVGQRLEERGMQGSQRKKTASTFRPLERGME